MKEKVWNKSNGIILASFFASAFLMGLIYKKLGFYPFGEKTNLIMDMAGQYSEFLAYLRHIFNSDNSLFFSWSRSMGGNFIGLFSYYIASPLSWITVLFSLADIPLAMFWLTIIKIGLCGMSFAIYVEHAFNEKKGKPVVILFAICYALMSYNMVYSLCVMWLDGVIMLPMVLLGVERLLKGKRGLFYLISIAALFIINYYTGYMIGIFTAIYFVYRILSTMERGIWKDILKKTGSFAGNTLLAVGLASPFLLPTIQDLASGRLAQSGYNPNLEYNFEFVKIFTKFQPGIYGSITNAGLPAIFCGSLILILAFTFLMQKNINWREKLGALGIFIFLLCSFWKGPLDLAWHGFQYPNWFPYRYSFLMSFFLIYLAYRSCMNLKINQKWRPIVLVAALLFVPGDMYQNGTQLIQGLENEFGSKTKAEYDTFYNQTMPLVEAVQVKDKGFYRMDKNYEFSKNDAMLLGYNGMTHYSSTYNASVNDFTRKLGIAQTYFWNSNYGSTPVTDSIFNVKYLLYDEMLPDAYSHVSQNMGITAYKNDHVLPIAFSAHVPEVALSLKDGNPFENQNELLNCLADTKESYFKKVEYQKQTISGGWKYTFTADSDNPIYLYMRGNQFGYGTVTVNGKQVGEYFTSETSCNLYLGQFQKGKVVTVACQANGLNTTSEYIYELSMNTYETAINQLSKGGMEVTRHKNGKLKGTITVGKNEKIFTSIPYDKGLVVKIDGKKVQSETFEDTFLVIPAEEGEHTVSIRYACPGFAMGMWLAVLALILILLIYRNREVREWLKRFKLFKKLQLFQKKEQVKKSERKNTKN